MEVAVKSVVLRRFNCQLCAGEGVIYTSAHGGNDPDVRAVRSCEACDGTGDERCDECLNAAAVIEVEHEVRRCKLCFDKE
jgi:DnaJ-class molecular chaperone